MVRKLEKNWDVTMTTFHSHNRRAKKRFTNYPEGVICLREIRAVPSYVREDQINDKELSEYLHNKIKQI